ncbi:DUF1440 domain-containing protein [Deinococcus aluminii]
MNPFLKAALAGCAATLPMSVWMLAAQHFLLPRRERYPLPPEQITEHAAEAAGLDAVADSEPVLKAATVFNHFAYGAATGALYAPLRELPGSPILKGMGLGLGVWTGSYLGLLPATGLLSSATEHPARRNALMIAAHLIWGGCTGVLAERKGARGG